MWKIATRLGDFPQTAGSGGGACGAGLTRMAGEREPARRRGAGWRREPAGARERDRSRISYGCSSSLLPLGRSRPMWIEADRIVGCSESCASVPCRWVAIV
jgi:hypothetical protein